jgi:hypothetical protein
MIHAILVATILVSFPEHSIPCRAVRRAVAQSGEAPAESWARAKGFSNKDIEHAKRASDSGRCFEAVVKAVPDQAAVLDSARLSQGRHDFHIVAIRRIRCDRVWGILSPAV